MKFLVKYRAEPTINIQKNYYSQAIMGGNYEPLVMHIMKLKVFTKSPNYLYPHKNANKSNGIMFSEIADESGISKKTAHCNDSEEGVAYIYVATGFGVNFVSQRN